MRVDLWTYDAQQYWRVYGQGTVTADGRQIVPDPGVALRPVTCANMLGGPGNAPPSWPKGGVERGDPVNVASGLFVVEKTDLAVADVLPIALTRVYRPNDVKPRGFGPGGSHAYQMFLIGDGGYMWADLVLAAGRRIHFTRISPPGYPLYDGVMEHTTTPTRFFIKLFMNLDSSDPWHGTERFDSWLFETFNLGRSRKPVSDLLMIVERWASARHEQPGR